MITNKVFSFKRPNNLITPRQRLLLQRLINTAYAGKTNLQNQLLEKTKTLTVRLAHEAITRIMELKPMVVA